VRGTDLINGAGLALAVATGTVLALFGAERTDTATAPTTASADGGVRERLPSGAWAVRGGDGTLLPVADYHRIVCLVPEADDAFAELGLTARLAGISAYSRAHSRHATALAAVPGTVATGAGVEAILALHPDLVVAAAFSDGGRNARLRAAGIPVFDLGSESGVADAARNLQRLAALCGDDAAGARLAHAFQRRLAHVADPAAARPRALYVAVWGRRLSGAATGTGGHDLLTAAGCRDAAADAGLTGWPDYQIEDLRRLDPDLIVTATGMGAGLADLPGAQDIRALRDHRIVEVDPDLLDSPGLTMLDAAEALADGIQSLPPTGSSATTAASSAMPAAPAIPASAP
jgi:iron complex transport system substrate-binding protein